MKGISRALLAGLLVLPLTRAASDEHAHPRSDDHEDAERAEESGAPDDAFTVEDFERFGVRLGTAGPGEVDLALELPGEIRPNADRIAHVAPRFPGIVREVRSRVGDRVRAGDVLARVESQSLSTFDVRAAFDGVVIDKHIAAGEAVRPERPAFVVADLSTVWAMISVYQSALPQVDVGSSVLVTASSANLRATGAISYVAPIVEQATRTATARVELPNPDGAWRPGLFVTATIVNAVAVPLVVPRQALQTLEDDTVVFVAQDGRFEARPVSVGRVGRTTAEITAGLSAGERFADERAFLVKAELAKGSAGHGHDH